MKKRAERTSRWNFNGKKIWRKISKHTDGGSGGTKEWNVRDVGRKEETLEKEGRGSVKQCPNTVEEGYGLREGWSVRPWTVFC